MCSVMPANDEGGGVGQEAAELDKLLSSARFSNNQYSQAIAAEEQRTAAAQKQIIEKQTDTRTLEESTSHCDTSAKELHQRLRRARDQSESSKRTNSLLDEHLVAVERKLELVQELQRKRRADKEGKVRHYQELWARHQDSYQNRSLARQLSLIQNSVNNDGGRVQEMEEEVGKLQESLAHLTTEISRRKENIQLEEEAKSLNYKAYVVEMARSGAEKNKLCVSIGQLREAISSMNTECRGLETTKNTIVAELKSEEECVRTASQPPSTASVVENASTSPEPNQSPVPVPSTPRVDMPRMQNAPRTDMPHLQSASRADIPRMQSAPQADIPRVQSAPQSGIPRMQSAPQAGIPRMQSAPRADIPRMQSAPQAGTSRMQSAPQADMAHTQSVNTSPPVAVTSTVVLANVPGSSTYPISAPVQMPRVSSNVSCSTPGIVSAANITRSEREPMLGANSSDKELSTSSGASATPVSVSNSSTISNMPHDMPPPPSPMSLPTTPKTPQGASTPRHGSSQFTSPGGSLQKPLSPLDSFKYSGRPMFNGTGAGLASPTSPSSAGMPFLQTWNSQRSKETDSTQTTGTPDNDTEAVMDSVMDSDPASGFLAIAASLAPSASSGTTTGNTADSTAAPGSFGGMFGSDNNTAADNSSSGFSFSFGSTPDNAHPTPQTGGSDSGMFSFSFGGGSGEDQSNAFSFGGDSAAGSTAATQQSGSGFSFGCGDDNASSASAGFSFSMPPGSPQSSSQSSGFNFSFGGGASPSSPQASSSSSSGMFSLF